MTPNRKPIVKTKTRAMELTYSDAYYLAKNCSDVIKRSTVHGGNDDWQVRRSRMLLQKIRAVYPDIP